MTIVAYRAGVLASDSLVTRGEERSGTVKKILRYKGHLFGVSGIPHYLKPFAQSIVDKIEFSFDCKDFSALHVTPEGKVFSYHGGLGLYPVEKKAPYYAIGTGSTIALGAMASGASAENAVRAAITHNIYCGGEVQKLKFNPNASRSCL